MRPFARTLAALALLLATPVLAQDRPVGTTPDEITFTQLPRLGQGVILHGDPSRRRPYVVRLNVPPNAEFPPHSHPRAESITVISGVIGFGEGPVFDKTKGRLLPAGSFYHLPARAQHFAWTGPEGAVIQAHGIGPFP